jgi:16S rRNA (cytidine1402-2'-O)-methyltransferase
MADSPRGRREDTTLAAAETAVARAEAGSLYVVGTPIGNLRDLTLRAIDMLRSVDIIAAEDTRVTATLLARYAIATRPRALHRHNEARQVHALVGELDRGRSVALVSDAGTPAISDPGVRLVRGARAAGPPVIPIPGATAIATAISAAGLEAERFAFIGFLPARPKARRELLGAIASWPVALVFYEAPHRVAATLADLAQALDARRMLTVARELTKAFETIATMPLAEASAWIAADSNRERGEFVLIVDAPVDLAVRAEASAEADRLLAALLEELPRARAARIAASLTAVPRDALYARAVALQARTRGRD